VYVLTSKLQDGKKISKWNHWAQQGQFLEFSDEHSMLVATVHHLTKGFVSLQFHVVFDDHFHTIYGDGEGNLITDAICNLLWENDQELYAEDKYGPDGSLTIIDLHPPTPFDKVWLYKEGLCKHHQRLLDKRRWVKLHTWIKKQAVPTSQTDDAPGSVPHHPIISEDTSVSDNDDNPDDASSFDSTILFEPEGDAWVDHGGPNNGLVLDKCAAT
jgi:hypothetical protein